MKLPRLYKLKLELQYKQIRDSTLKIFMFQQYSNAVAEWFIIWFYPN